VIKQTIKFEDFDGNEVTEEHYFHLSTAQIMEWVAEKGDDLGTQMENTVKNGSGGEIMLLFREIIEKSYGDRQGGSSFVRSPEITARFMDSLAFEAFFGELLTDDKKATEFFNGIMPQKLVKQLQTKQIAPGVKSIEFVENEAEEDQRSGLKAPRDNDGNLVPWAHRKPTLKEQQAMTKAQLQDVMMRMNRGWEPTVESV